MIKLIHKYNRSIAVVFLFVAFCFALSGVGIDVLHDGNRAQRPAIEVNDKSFSQADFQRAERTVEERYRKMFGNNFEQYAQMFGLDVTQQTIDQLIDSTLFNQQAAAIGFAADDQAVRTFILEKIFANMPYDETRFRGLLQSAGLTFREFSSEIKEEYSRDALTNLIQDSAYVSKSDIEAQIIRQETSYKVVAALVQTAEIRKSLPAPSEEQLKAFYDQNPTRFEVPAQVSYSFIELAPASFEKNVQVSQQDVEVYYTENSSQFTTPEEVRVREIKVLYPKDANDKAKADTKAKAKQAHEEALAGKVFQELVTKYTDDAAAKLNGGDRGWVARGSETPQYEKAVFAGEAGSVAEIIETQQGFQIVKVEEKKSSSLKPLDTVRAQIEAEIRKNEAPSYASSKGQELIKSARREGKSLPEVAGISGLPVKESGVLASAEKDPSPALKGLTAKVLELPSGDRMSVSLVELGDTSALVQIKEFKDPSISPFSEVRSRIADVVTLQESQKAAEKRANDIVTATQAAPHNFESEAKKLGATIVGPVEISRANPTVSELQDLPPQAQSSIFATTSTPMVIARSFPTQSGFLVASVVSIKKPEAAKTRSAEAIAKYRAETQQEASRDALDSALTILKTAAIIEVDPALQNRR